MGNDKQADQLFLLDAYALIFRAYFAFSKNPRYNSRGENTSAVFGFTNTLLEILEKEEPEHIAVVFDTAATTEREKEYADYKAHREETPEDIIQSVPYIKRILEGFRIPILMKDGFEADDVIGTIAKQAEAEGYTTYMMSSDKDLGQLVSDHIYLYKPRRMGSGVEILGRDEICEKFGIEDPIQVIDVLGLWGDASDNIPGIPGVGEKRAKQFISQYGSIERLYENTHELKGKLKENVEAHKEEAFLSKRLATIVTDVPIDVAIKDLKRGPMDPGILQPVFDELEFRKIAERVLPGDQGEKAGQQELFQGESQESSLAQGLDDLSTVPHTYTLIEDHQTLEASIAALKKAGRFCFDTETTGTDPHASDLVGIAFSGKPGTGFYVPMNSENMAPGILKETLKPLFEDPELKKIGHNLKFDISVLYWHGIRVKGPFLDTMILHYLQRPDQRHKLDLMAENWLKYRPVPIEDILGKKGKDQKRMDQFKPEEIRDYACEDADITLQLANALEPLLDSEYGRDLHDRIEAPLIPVLSSMEREGVCVDQATLKALSACFLKEIKRIEASIFEEAGTEFNINSPKQLGEVLFEKLKIVDNPKKTRSGQYATNEDTLAQYIDQHPIIQKIFDVRSLHKLRNTYVEALPKLINPRTDRIHTSFNQTVTSTGRLSSTHPNLQNIPIRSENGRAIRKAFVPRDREHLLLAADYSQIELRIMAHMSQDEGLLKTFRKGADVHSTTAARIHKVEPGEVTDEHRRVAKTVNFGIIYGISAHGLSQRIGISRHEAADIIDSYFEQYPGVKAYMDRTIEKAKQNGYVETLTGRRRYLPEINSSNGVVRGNAERNAINAPVQGTAADMIKIAMIDVHNTLHEKEYRSKMILQVHDELVLDAHRSELEGLQPMIREKMENAMSLDAPIEIECGTGENWLEAH